MATPLTLHFQDCNQNALANRKIVFTPVSSPNISGSFLSIGDPITLMTDNTGSLTGSLVPAFYNVAIPNPSPETDFLLNVNAASMTVASASIVSGSAQTVFFDLINLVADPFSVRKVNISPASTYPRLFSGSIISLSTTSSLTDVTGSTTFYSLVPQVYQVDCLGKVVTTFYIDVPNFTYSGSAWNVKDLLVVKPNKGIVVKLSDADKSFVLSVSSSDARYLHVGQAEVNFFTSSYSLTSDFAILAGTAITTLSSSIAVSASWASQSAVTSFANSAQTAVAAQVATLATTALTSSFYIGSGLEMPIIPTSSFAISASWSPPVGATLTSGSTQNITASWAINAINGGTQLNTGSTYPITSSWSQNSTNATLAAEATIADGINQTATSTNAAYYIPFTSTNAAGNVTPYSDLGGNLQYNPSTATLSVPHISGTSSYSLTASVAQFATTASFSITTFVTQSSFTGSLSASWASASISASSASVAQTASYLNPGTYSVTSSWSVNAINGGTQLNTGSTYPITSSWANNTKTASNAPNYVLKAGDNIGGALVLQSGGSVDSTNSGNGLRFLGGDGLPHFQFRLANDDLLQILEPSASIYISGSTISASLIGNALTATSASWSPAAQPGTTLFTGSVYPITSSWARTSSVAQSASYVKGANVDGAVLSATNATFATIGGFANSSSWSAYASQSGYTPIQFANVAIVNGSLIIRSPITNNWFLIDASDDGSGSYTTELTPATNTGSLLASSSIFVITSSFSLSSSISASWASQSLSSLYASQSLSASYAVTASYALNAASGSGGGGSNLSTGSLVPITSSWAQNVISASGILYPYFTHSLIVTSSTNWITASFLYPNQKLDLTTTQSYSFTSSDNPRTGMTADILLYISHSALVGTSSLVFPSTWKNLGVGWPSTIVAGTIATIWLRGHGSSSIFGTYNVSGSSNATSSWAISSSWAPGSAAATYTSSLFGTSSWAVNAINGGTQLNTGSTYPITSSWANNSQTASYVFGTPTVIVTAPPFNAKNDNSADATNAIQLAINSLTGSNVGGVVFFPAGLYNIQGTINLFRDISLVGESSYGTGYGSRLRRSNSVTASIVNISGSNANQVSIRNLTFDGGLQTSSSVGLNIVSSSIFDVIGCSFIQFGTGVRIRYSWIGNFKSCNFQYNTASFDFSNNVNLINIEDGLLTSNVYALSSSGNNSGATDCDGWNIFGNDIESNTNGLLICPNVFAANIQGNHFEAQSNIDISLSGSAKTNIWSNTFASANAATNIWSSQSYATSIRDNIFLNSASLHLALDSNQYTHREGNTFWIFPARVNESNTTFGIINDEKTSSFANTISGLIQGAISASWASQSFSASYSKTSSFAISQSFTISNFLTSSISSSWASQSLSASWAPGSTAATYTSSLFGTASWAVTALNAGSTLLTGSTVPITSSISLLALTASYMSAYESYATDLTSSTQWITASFAYPSQIVNLTNAALYSFTHSNMPTAGQDSDLILFVSHSANATSSLVMPSTWTNLGNGWPTAIGANTIGVFWLRAIDTNKVIGTFNISGSTNVFSLSSSFASASVTSSMLQGSTGSYMYWDNGGNLHLFDSRSGVQRDLLVTNNANGGQLDCYQVKVTSGTGNTACVFGADSRLISSPTTLTQIGYLQNVTSDVQTQLNARNVITGSTVPITASWSTNTNNIVVTQSATNASYYVPFVSTNLGIPSVVNDNINFLFNPSSGSLTLTNGIIDFGISVKDNILLLYHAGLARYGFGIQPSEMRQYVSDTAQFNFGYITSSDGTTFTSLATLSRGSGLTMIVGGVTASLFGTASQAKVAPLYLPLAGGNVSGLINLQTNGGLRVENSSNGIQFAGLTNSDIIMKVPTNGILQFQGLSGSCYISGSTLSSSLISATGIGTSIFGDGSTGNIQIGDGTIQKTVGTNFTLNTGIVASGIVSATAFTGSLFGTSSNAKSASFASAAPSYVLKAGDNISGPIVAQSGGSLDLANSSNGIRFQGATSDDFTLRLFNNNILQIQSPPATASIYISGSTIMSASLSGTASWAVNTVNGPNTVTVKAGSIASASFADINFGGNHYYTASLVFATGFSNTSYAVNVTFENVTASNSYFASVNNKATNHCDIVTNITAAAAFPTGVNVGWIATDHSNP